VSAPGATPAGAEPLLARDWALPLGFVLLAGVALPFITRETTAVPTSPIWLAGVMAIAIATLMPRRERIRWFDPVAAAAIGLAAAAPHLHAGMVIGHDSPLHTWAALGYLDSWRHGDWLPIWLHQLGFGQPQPLFYGPLPFWLMAPFASFGPAGMISGSLALSEVVAALAAWHVLARWTRRPEPALVAAAAWAYAPYRLLDAHYRTALGESWSLALMPWILAAYFELLQRPTRRRCLAASFVTALLVLVHPLSLAMLALLLPVLWLATVISGGLSTAWRTACAGVAAALGSLLLVSFFTVPMLVEMPAINLAPSVGGRSGPHYPGNAAHLDQLVDRQLFGSLGWSIPETTTGDDGPDEMPYYAGVALLAALVAALSVALRAARRSTESPLLAMAVVAAAAIALAVAPVAHLVGRVPGVAILQFPWRLLGPAGAAAALALGLLVARVPREAGFVGRVLVVALLGLTVVDGFPYSGAVSRVEAWQALSRFAWIPGVQRVEPVEGSSPFRVRGQFLPPNRGDSPVGTASSYREYYTPAVAPLVAGHADKRARVDLVGVRRQRIFPYARFMTSRRAKLQPLPYSRGGGRIEVDVRGQRGELEVGEQYFPGWQVDLGKGWREAGANQAGLISVRVPPGRERVRFRFDRWRWDRLLGWSMTLVACIGALVAWRRPVSAE